MITENMFIPDVVSKYSATRAIFDKYGLKGCGGPFGPKETLLYFSKVHGVDLKTLSEELNTVVKEKHGESEPLYKQSHGDIIYKKFFKSGIVVVLTVGCLIGAINLLIYGILHSFTVVKLLPLTHAHGNAMVFGFLGIFVMGFSYQGLPRLKQVSLYRPEFAELSLELMITGIIIRFISLVIPDNSKTITGLVSTMFQLVSVVIFLSVMIKTFSQSTKKEIYDKYIYTGFIYFLLIAILEPILFYYTSSAKDEKSLLYIISTFFGPLRDIQFLGFATMMILGVSQRLFPSTLSMREVKNSTSNMIFVCLNIALIIDVISYLLMRSGYYLTGGIGLQVSYLLFFIFSLTFVYSLKMFRNTDLSDRSVKFVKASFVWFIISFVMLALFPVYNYLTNQHFSHAFSGATRHAFTVGFITMMIIGVSSKIVPMLSGKNTEKLSYLTDVFVLLNFGNALRVSTQILTDFTPLVYPVMGISGFIEVLALGIWGYDIFKNMKPEEIYEKYAGSLPEKITSDMKVADVVEMFPQTLEIFFQHGFTDLKNPILRKTIAKRASLKMACSIHSVDINKFLDILNQKIQSKKM